MKFDLIEKLKEELRLIRNDLSGYEKEKDRLEKVKADAHLELERAYAVLDGQLNDLSVSITFSETAVREYASAINTLIAANGENNVNG